MAKIFIIDSKDLQRQLHELYGNRQFIQFVFGDEKFNQQALDIWANWINGNPKTLGEPGDETLDYLNSPEFHKMCWEIENDYFEDLEEAA